MRRWQGSGDEYLLDETMETALDVPLSIARRANLSLDEVLDIVTDAYKRKEIDGRNENSSV
jgi:hypothetical protein